MLKEGLMFLEAENEISKEITADSVKVLRDIIEKILELCEAANQEELIKNQLLQGRWQGY